MAVIVAKGIVLAYTSNRQVCVVHHSEATGWRWQWCCLHSLVQPRPPLAIGNVITCSAPAGYHFFYRGDDTCIHEIHCGSHNHWKPQHACVNTEVTAGVIPPALAKCDPVVTSELTNERRLYYVSVDRKQILSMGDAFNNGVACRLEKIMGFGRLPLVNSPSGNGEQLE